MTPENLELTVRLARWMGWTEVDGVRFDERQGRIVNLALSEHPHPPSPPWPVNSRGDDWQPLTRPDHAAEVMAEAVRRGWRVGVTAGPNPFRLRAGRSRSAEGADALLEANVEPKGGAPRQILIEAGAGAVAAGWFRAVCLAVLAAAEGGAT